MGLDGIFRYVRKCETLDRVDVELREQLRSQVEMLAGTIGERHYGKPGALRQAIVYLEDVWEGAGFTVHSQEYTADGDQFRNLWVELPGSDSDSVIVVGAHYDSIWGTPGADDNASAVAALLSLSLRARPGKKTIRFVAFANEEPPFFMSEGMGSLVYARSCRAAGDKIERMVCLEMLGYYCESQPERLGLLPEKGDFICLVGNPDSTPLVKRAIRGFEKSVAFPLVGATVPPEVIPYAAFSDHWSFWQCGYPAFMVTDTGPLRNPNYHAASDLPDTLDFDRMALVVQGVAGVIEELTR